jgi:xylulokinase
MAQKSYILAHDLGTTGNKAILVDTFGNLVTSAYCAYETDYCRPNWAEQNPKDWIQAICDSTHKILVDSKISPERIAVVSFSGHMNGILAVDAQGNPLHPAIIWADQRSTKQADLISEKCGSLETYHLTGIRVSPGYTAAKLLWIKENEPEIYAKTFKVLQAKDYAAYFLTGIFATDYSDASLTQLLDLEKHCWAENMLETLGISADLMPKIYPSAAVIGEITQAAAAKTGLRPGTPVVIGGGDGACATVGAGSIHVGDIYNYIGSSSWMALTTNQPVLDIQQRTFNFLHLDPNLYIAIGTMQAAGGAFDWFESLFREKGEEKRYDDLNLAAGMIPPGGNGLIFLPYLLGERSPYWNPLARSAFIGLAMPDGRAQMARAVMEGVAFNLRIILDVLLSQGVKTRGMRLIGG